MILKYSATTFQIRVDFIKETSRMTKYDQTQEQNTTNEGNVVIPLLAIDIGKI